jgi:serine/threonine-protein kinase RsbW
LRESGSSVQARVASREFVFPADLTAMVAARDAILEFIHHESPDEQTELDILIAVQEALANAVLHGAKTDPGKTIHCLVDVDASAIAIVIRDPGKGFDAVGEPETAEDGTNLTSHGRGILLMRSLMDEVTYRRHGTEIRMKKYRNAES